MITRRLCETAEMLVYDPVASNRNATRASLHSLGFRRVETCPSLDVLSNRLRSRCPDLLLVEVAGAEAEACALIQALRQGHLGDNPFAVVIVTTWRRDGSIVTQVLNSGADDLVARPISTTMLGERIRLITDRRKGFVVTSDYIGPDRRRNARSGGASAECIEIPNPLRIRSMDSVSEEEAERQIVESVELGKLKVNIEKVRRDAVQLCLQWRMLEQRTPGARDFCEILPRIERIAGEMKRRAGAADQTGAEEWCTAVIESVQALAQIAAKGGESGDGADYRPRLSLLAHSALTLGQMYAAEEVAPARLVVLDQLVARRSARSAA